MKIDVPDISIKGVEPLIAQGDRAIASGDGAFDFSAVERGDSSAVAALLHWRRSCEKAGVAFSVSGLPVGIRDLCDLYEVEPLLAKGASKGGIG